MIYSNCCNDHTLTMGQTLPYALCIGFLIYSLKNSTWCMYIYIIPILQMKELKQREVKWLVKDLTRGKWQKSVFELWSVGFQNLHKFSCVLIPLRNEDTRGKTVFTGKSKYWSLQLTFWIMLVMLILLIACNHTIIGALLIEIHSFLYLEWKSLSKWKGSA